MSRSWKWLVYALVLGLAALASWRGGESATQSELPTTENPGPRGARAVFRYLEARGYPVRAHHAPLLALPVDTRTLVLAAPDAREISTDEVAALARFVDGGGTLVYLTPRPLGSTQPAMSDWLGLPREREAAPGATAAEDVASALSRPPQRTHVAARQTFTRWRKLSVRKAPGLSWEALGMLPLALYEEDPNTESSDAALLYSGRGDGEILIGAGPDLIENAGITKADNVLFWELLAARGPMRFDEYHHRADAVPLPASLLAVAAQCVLVFAAFVWARGTRLGPPRPLLDVRHRSVREYLESFATLTQQAKVEPALLAESWRGLRRTLHARVGIPISSDDAEAAALLARARDIEPSEFLALAREVHTSKEASTLSPKVYVRLTREIALLENWLTGVASSPR